MGSNSLSIKSAVFQCWKHAPLATPYHHTAQVLDGSSAPGAPDLAHAIKLDESTLSPAPGQGKCCAAHPLDTTLIL